jgi:hypothetical protein
MFKTRILGIMALALTGALVTACDDDDDLEDLIDARIDALDLDDDFGDEVCSHLQAARRSV